MASFELQPSARSEYANEAEDIDWLRRLVDEDIAYHPVVEPCWCRLVRTVQRYRNLPEDFLSRLLHLCAFFGKTEYCTMLLAAGASINYRDSNSNGALHVASWGNTTSGRNASTIDTLLRLGAETASVSRTTISPLFPAIYLGDIATIESLLRHGVRADDGVVEDRGGSLGKRTALCVAIEEGNVNIAILLVSKGGATLERDASVPSLDEARVQASSFDAEMAFRGLKVYIEQSRVAASQPCTLLR